MRHARILPIQSWYWICIGERIDRNRKVAELTSELAATKETAAQAAAKICGLEVQIAALRAGIDKQVALPDEPHQTDAILSILRSAEGTLSPSEVTTRLNEAGRSENLKTVASLLSYLLKENRVQRPERGRYMVA